MENIETAKRTARVPILGDNGRISDDYVPAAIGEGVEQAEAAKTAAEAAKTAAEKAQQAAEGAEASVRESASAASESAAQAASSQTAAKASEDAAKESAQQAQQSADSMGESVQQAAQSASEAQQSASEASSSATQAEGARDEAKAAQTASEGARDAAKTSETNAKTSETNAAQSATTASDKADAASGSADEAASSAASAKTQADAASASATAAAASETNAKAAQTAAEGAKAEAASSASSAKADADRAEAAKESAEYVYGNVLTDTTAKAPVAHAEDAYGQPAVTTKVYGRTVNNLWTASGTATNNGITATAEDDGLIAITVDSETAVSDNASMTFQKIPVVPSETLSVLVTNSATGCVPGLNFYDANDIYITGKNVDFNGNKTFQVPENATSALCRIWCQDVTAVNAGAIRVTLVRGGEIPEFNVPSGMHDVAVDEITTGGRNLLQVNDLKQAYQGVDYSVEDGSINASGTATETGKLSLDKINLNPGDYLLSMTGETVNNASAALFRDLHTQHGYWTSFTEQFQLVDKETLTTAIGAISIGEVLIKNGHIQVEYGTTASAYEPPTVTETTVDPPVDLRSLPDGTCDVLTVDQDGKAVVDRVTGYIESYTDADKDTIGTGYVASELNADGSAPAEGAHVVYRLAEPTTETLSDIKLPALPAPTFNRYVSSGDVPADVEVEYVQDVNKVVDSLEARIAALELTDATE